MDQASSAVRVEDFATDKQSKGNAVLHPDHYLNHPSGVECIKIVQEFPYNVGVAVAYCWRHQHKGSPVRDLEKAIQHLQFEVERLRGLAPERNRATDDRFSGPVCGLGG